MKFQCYFQTVKMFLIFTIYLHESFYIVQECNALMHEPYMIINLYQSLLILKGVRVSIKMGYRDNQNLIME